MSLHHEQQYLDLLQKTLELGSYKDDRTGVGCYSLFGVNMAFDLNEGFPLFSVKHTPFRQVLAELLWFISGSTNVYDLNALGCHIWDQWADEHGDLGPLYGKQWRAWDDTKIVTREVWDTLENTAFPEYTFITEITAPDQVVIRRSIDQLNNLILGLRQQPDSRRHYLSAWNPGVVPNVYATPQENVAMGNAALAACHPSVEFHAETLSESELQQYLDGPDLGIVPPTHRLNCHFHMRSNDAVIGTPFNIASYALLTQMVAQCVNMEVGTLTYSCGDFHVYANHVEAVKEMLSPERTPQENPTWVDLEPGITNIDVFTMESFVVIDYDPHPAIKLPVAK